MPPTPDTTPERAHDETLKVGATTPVHRLAGSIAKSLRAAEQCALQCIGAGAVNQAVKAATVARKFLRDDGIDLAIVPDFVDIDLGGASQADRQIVSGVQLTLRRTALIEP